MLDCIDGEPSFTCIEIPSQYSRHHAKAHSANMIPEKLSVAYPDADLAVETDITIQYQTRLPPKGFSMVE